MRMAGPDIVLFVVGALLFGGATYAIVSEGALGTTGSAAGVFNVAYETETVELDSLAVADYRSATLEFDVAQGNVSKLVVTLGCTDPVSAAVPFTIQATLTGPGGLMGEGSGACGTAIVIEVPVADAPTAATVLGSTEDEARENLPEADNATAAQGAWTLEISGGRQGAPPILPVGNPGGTAVVSAEVWTPTFTPVVR